MSVLLRFCIVTFLSFLSPLLLCPVPAPASYMDFGDLTGGDHGPYCLCHGLYELQDGDSIDDEHTGSSPTGYVTPIWTGPISFSVMPAGSTPDPYATGLTTDFSALFAGDELAIVHAAFAVWIAATGSVLRDLGTVPDSGAPFNAPPYDPVGTSGPFGDIRLAAVDIYGPALAHAYFPPPYGRSASGDIYFDNRVRWADDPTDTTADSDYDFFTVALHELGHALGLGHSTNPNSIMYAYYRGARRTLNDLDVTSIQGLYGYSPPPADTPELATLILLSGGLLGLTFRRLKNGRPRGINLRRILERVGFIKGG